VALYIEAGYVADLLNGCGYVAAADILHFTAVQANEVMVVAQTAYPIAQAAVAHQDPTDGTFVLQKAHGAEHSSPPRRA
jgi:hypothetical protein